MLLLPLSACTRALSPDAAVALGTAGVCLGFVEFNRPGRVIPGALGLLLLLFSCAALLQHPIRPLGAAALGAGIVLLVANLWRRLPIAVLALATAGLVLGLRFLVPTAGPAFVHTPAALACGALLGASSGALTRLAYRARRSKALD